MKILIMCEGSNEEALIEMLLDNNKLKITRDDLIGRKAFHVRKLNVPFIKSELKMYNSPVKIYRIGDKQSDKLEIPKELKHIVEQANIFKFCTKPELEILLVINENMFSTFKKSRMEPKEFAKEKICLNGKYYNNQTSFLVEYYSGANINKLVNNIKEYKRLKKHTRDELYLADILK